MFIGHFGIGFGAKKAAPKISLGTLFLAAQFLDLLWPTFLLLGWEKVKIEPGNTVMTPLDFTHYPWSHSLLMAIVWGILFGIVYYFIRKRKYESILLGVLVVSHWILDLLVHGPDLLLYPGSSWTIGWGLWNHQVTEILVEGGIFIIGVWFYLQTTKARDRIGKHALWPLIIFLVVIHLGNIVGPPPPDVNAIAWVGEAQWLLVLWAYWVDRHRMARKKLPPAMAGEPETNWAGKN